MISLYDKPECPFCFKVRLALEASGAPYQILDYQQEPHKSQWPTLTPGKTVPVLVDGEVVIHESAVMLEYLQERYGGLLPAEPSQRAKVRLLASYADSTLGRAIRDVIFEKRGRPEAEWDQQRLAQGHQAWLDALPYLAQQLRQQRFFGEHYSLADMVLSARMGLAYGYGLKIPDSLPNLQQWFARMTTLPAFQKTAPPVVLEKLAATVEADTVQDYV